MAHHELFDRSPIRLFDQISGGGLHAGELGLIASRKGLGKTSVLVQFGIDALLKNEGVVHVSFDQRSENVMTWYADVFSEIAKKKNAASSADMLAELVRKRVILNFSQDGAALSRVAATIDALIGSGVSTRTVLIDDLDFAKVSADELQKLSDFAKQRTVSVWISTATDDTALSQILAADLLPFIDITVLLESKPDALVFELLKVHGDAELSAMLKLDSKTLLITEYK
ncbi:ATPase domain-containing protein [Treponema endosymbiont of Eucomonympha sp.]|uniref:ATPase domain-containing protein n=1 Tax=Treponema endosymbiont of Eucomonympha sp. TaxID=1580831 RepID=UPI000750B7D3|nr:ATPase domain-containing protein [Treponema endosymbiont of Eucomonympha sp.]